MEIYKVSKRDDAPKSSALVFIFIVISFIFNSKYIMILAFIVFFWTGLQMIFRPDRIETKVSIITGILCVFLSSTFFYLLAMGY
jgi:hypothetical protein